MGSRGRLAAKAHSHGGRVLNVKFVIVVPSGVHAVLQQFFRERFSKELKRATQGFTEETKQRMLAYRWPGNVRELQNRVKRAVLVSENPLLELPELNTGGQMEHTNGEIASVILPLKDEKIEKESIIKALQICNGHREQAVRLLKINPATLYRKMKKYGLR